MTTSIVPQKRCLRGEDCAHPDGPDLPATTEYFHTAKSNRDGLKNTCKACQSVFYREWRITNADAVKAYKAEWAKKNEQRLREKRRRYYQSNKARILRNCALYRQNNLETKRAQNRAYHARNKERMNAYGRLQNRLRPDITRQRWTAWSSRNREREQELKRLSTERRLARKRSLPDNFSMNDWDYAKAWWNHSCAYCGKATTIEMDHLIPLASTDCPGTVRENMVPACRFCNASKADRTAKEWLTERFGVERALSAMARIREYLQELK